VMNELIVMLVLIVSLQGCAGHDSSVGVQVPGGARTSIEDKEVQKPADADGDTITDEADMCPGDPEDPDGFDDTDGCPDPDNDKDSIPDGDDQCPSEAETFNGAEDEDGCPDIAEVKITSSHCCMLLVPAIYFNRKGAKIQKKSEALIDQTAAEIVGNPQIRKVLVLGESSEMLTDEANVELSAKRAFAVIDALLSKGVAIEVLVPLGIGSLCAVAGKGQLNDSVEIRLLETDDGCFGCPFVCDKAVSSGSLKDEILKYMPGSDYCKSKEKK
jgi:OOP family OmpA-OmpF porin